MKSLVLFFIFLISSSVLSDNVFSEKEVRISFRYPEDWSERKPQLHTTLVLLFWISTLKNLILNSKKELNMII